MTLKKTPPPDALHILTYIHKKNLSREVVSFSSNNYLLCMCTYNFITTYYYYYQKNILIILKSFSTLALLSCYIYQKRIHIANTYYYIRTIFVQLLTTILCNNRVNSENSLYLYPKLTYLSSIPYQVSTCVLCTLLTSLLFPMSIMGYEMNSRN